jgi:hypothetical protein
MGTQPSPRDDSRTLQYLQKPKHRVRNDLLGYSPLRYTFAANMIWMTHASNIGMQSFQSTLRKPTINGSSPSIMQNANLGVMGTH